MQSYKSFSKRYFLWNQMINLFFLNPLAFAFIVLFIKPNDEQLNALIIGLISSLVVAQILQYVLVYQLRTIKTYFDKVDTNSKTAITEVSTAVEYMKVLTQSTAAGLEQMTATSDGITSIADKMRIEKNFKL